MANVKSLTIIFKKVYFPSNFPAAYGEIVTRGCVSAQLFNIYLMCFLCGYGKMRA